MRVCAALIHPVHSQASDEDILKEFSLGFGRPTKSQIHPNRWAFSINECASQDVSQIVLEPDTKGKQMVVVELRFLLQLRWGSLNVTLHIM